MQDVHNIKPTLSHYACMVDLYGRSGLLREAWDLIKCMPVGTGCCCLGYTPVFLQSALECGKLPDLQQKSCLLLDPHNSGAYSALANLYSATGKWDDDAKIRKRMKDEGVKKEQVSGWVQIRGHVFGAEDCLHPQKEVIYKKMEEIWKEITEMDVFPHAESVVHDLEDEANEMILKHHSEKIALPFAVFSTPENTTARIMKNLRVCYDCHSDFMYISKLVGREIIVMDCTRFHHFIHGYCSCRVYW